jgi:hypothetical protein
MSTDQQPAAGWSLGRAALLLGLALAAIGVIVYATTRGATATAKAQPAVTGAAAVGECAAADGNTSLQALLVGCGGDSARYDVLQVFPGTDDRTKCADVPGTSFALLQPATAHRPAAVVCVEDLRQEGHAVAQ